jgi:hypothetical protein
VKEKDLALRVDVAEAAFQAFRAPEHYKFLTTEELTKLDPGLRNLDWEVLETAQPELALAKHFYGRHQDKDDENSARVLSCVVKFDPAGDIRSVRMLDFDEEIFEGLPAPSTASSLSMQ